MWFQDTALRKPDWVDLINPAITGNPFLALRAEPTREACGCVSSVDIGAYDTCLFGCAYCYATSSHQAAVRRHAEHDPQDTALWRPEAMRGNDLEKAAAPLKK